MRHRKHTCKLSRTGTHKRAMLANMLKSLIVNERIETTIPKAKELRRHADNMITLAKKNTLASRRLAKARMQIRFNTLTPKEKRITKKDNVTSFYNTDRKVLNKLFSDLKDRFENRNGGYTRIIKKENRQGDGAQKCIIEYLEETKVKS